MGGGGSKQKQKQRKPAKYEPAISKDWEISNRTDNGAVYRDRNGREADEYKYILDNRYAPSHEFNVYDQRRNATVPIVKSYGAEMIPAGSALAPRNEMRVLTERIPHRLSNIPQLTFPESLYVLDESLNGYEHLYRKAGSFHVNQDMIGFTPEGETKVWFNENYGENHPSRERHVLQSTLEDRNYLSNTNYNAPVSDDEAALVRNICQVVEDKSEEGIFRDEKFKSQIYRDRVGFTEARNIIQNTRVEHNFVPINHIDLHNHLICIRKAHGWSHQEQVVSKPDYVTTTHHQSYVRPVATNQQVVTSTYEQRPAVSYRETHVSSVPKTTTLHQTYIQPQVTSTTVNTGAVYHNSYQPMPSAKKKTNYLFNYIAPKENFHPDMYAERRY